MKEIIERLDKWIKENRPDYYKDLNPGLTPDEIKEWESKLDLELPEDFKLFYQWRNGQKEENQEDFFHSCSFSDMENVFEHREFENEELEDSDYEEGEFWAKSWLRFMVSMDEGGWCLDVEGDLEEPGNIIQYLNTQPDQEVYYPNIKTMLEVIVNQFEQGAYGYETTNGLASFGVISEEKISKIENQFI